MANSKISALTSATTPLAGTETLPIVQSSATVKVAANDLTVRNIRANATTGILQVTGPTAGTTRVVTVPDANFTAARTDAAQSFTGDQTLSTGNLIQGTAAKGINFTANTPAAGMTSQLLNWYETGTFTPTYYGSSTAGTTTYTLQSGTYTRTGNVLYYNIRLAWSGATGTGSGTIGGFPYSAQNAYHTASILPSDYTLTALNIMSARIGFGNTMALFQTPVGGGAQTAVGMDTAAELTITGFYLI